MPEQTIITMRRADGKLQELHGPRAADVAARRAERDGWEYVDLPGAHPEADAEAVVAAPPDEQSVEPAQENDGGYEAMTVAELRTVIQERDLAVPSDARKADLIAALEAADAESAGEDAP